MVTIDDVRAIASTLPRSSEALMRGRVKYHWAHVDLSTIGPEELRDIVEEAWSFCVPKRVVDEYTPAAAYR